MAAGSRVERLPCRAATAPGMAAIPAIWLTASSCACARADRTHVLELGSQATVADVKAAVEAAQGEARRRAAAAA